MLRGAFLRLLLIFFSLACFFVSSSSVLANNKIGIHVLEPQDLIKAAHLVNSSGGDWGYVTFVIREDDFNRDKWQSFFNECRRLHLIPIVRLATRMMTGGFWAKPEIEELEKWPQFLNSLNWPIKQQIVVIFNEPNHSQEWGGEINPQEYALVLDRLINLFKQVNPNFFILGAGLDQAAGNTKSTMDEVKFLQEMIMVKPEIFNLLDGWASHNYPNHGFIGLPEDKGRATIRGYQWELQVLEQLGLNKKLPVYITEAGWPHQEGVDNEHQFYPAEKTAVFLEKALAVWQEDSRVKAITPFVLNYPLPPFDHFSWFNQDGSSYPQFDRVLGISKNRAEPEQIQSYEIIKVVLADFLPTDYLYKGKIVIKNTGQWIMGERGSFKIEVKQSDNEIQISEIKLPKNKLVFSDEEIILDFEVKTGTRSEEHNLVLGDNDYKIYVFKPWDLKNQKVSLWQQIRARINLWWLDFTRG